MAKAKKRKQTARIYYGPPGRERSMWWTVSVTDAKQPVTISGSTLAVLRSLAGRTIGCSLSNFAVDAGQAAFGFKPILVAVTKSTMLVVDQVKNGAPKHAVRYGHKFGDLVDSNDTGTLKGTVKENPDLVERLFTFTPPRKHIGCCGSKYKGSHVRSGSARGPVLHRGALGRAVKAGLIDRGVAGQLTRATS